MADFSALKTSIQNYIKQNGNEEITGNLLQQILLSMVTTLGDSAINDLVTALNAEIANRGNADTTLQGNINSEAAARGNADTELGGRITTLQGVVNGIKANVENGYVYAGIATPSTTPVSGKVFYLALTAGTYTNFGATVVPQGINILKYNGSAWSLDSFLGLDDAPTQGSNNLVKSGGVLDSIIKDGSAFDLSAYNSGATYADLSAALTALNALPAAYKKGGMSFKYVQTSDNKYVQWRLMANSFSTTVSDWQGVDDEPTAGSENLVKSGGVYAAINHSIDLSSIQTQYGTSSDGSFVDGTTDIKIDNPTNTRVFIGPFILNDSVEIDCNTGFKYKLYALMQGSSMQNYCDVYSTWQTDRHIFGASKNFPDLFKCYILISYTDDRVIGDKDVMKGDVALNIVNQKNPWGLISTYSWDRSNNLPAGGTSFIRTLCIKKFDFDCNLYTKCEYWGIKTAENNTIYGFFSTENPKIAMKGRNLMLTDKNMKNFTSFEDLYEAIGLSYGDRIELVESDISNAPMSFAAPWSSGLAFKDETREVNTVSSNNRILIGPFSFTHDTEISCDSDMQYMLYFCFADDTQGYTQLYSAWQTEKRIIGVNPYNKDTTLYYLMISKTDNNSMLYFPVVEWVKKIHLSVVDGQNPLHVIHCNTWSAQHNPVGAYNTPFNLRFDRVMFEIPADEHAYMYIGNANMLFSAASADGIDFVANSTQAVDLPMDKAVKILARQNVTAYNIFEHVHTFKELYENLNINIEHYDFKEIQGSAAFSNGRYNEAATRGTQVSANIASGLVLDGENIGYSHTPSLNFHDGKAYVAMQTNTSGVETNPDTSIVVCTINPSNNELISTTKVAGEGTYGGVTFDGACTNCYSYFIGSILHIVFNAHFDGKVGLVHCAFNTANNTFTNTICSLNVDGTSYQFNVTNFADKIGRINGIKGLGYEVVMSQIASDGTYYYSAVSSGAFGNGKTCILKTSDFITWQLFAVLPMKYGSDCETAIIIADGYIFGASRHNYLDATICIWKMNIQNKKVIDSVQINDCATRPTWFKDNNGVLFLAHGLDGRGTLQILRIMPQLAQSFNYLEAYPSGGAGYNSIKEDGGVIYIAIQNNSGYDTPRIRFSSLL